MEPHWNLRDFLSAASQRLEMVPIAIRVFSADGLSPYKFFFFLLINASF